MLYLKQSTASQAVLLGPFVDSTDGVTAETGLTIANTDIRLSKNGGNIAAKNSGGGTHDENGFYQITLDATDTDTVGRLQIHAFMTGALPVFAEFQVVEEAIYDKIFAASGAFNDPTAAAVADAVWDEARSGHTTAGSFGEGVIVESSKLIYPDNTASGTPTTTTMVSDLGVTVNDQFNGRVILFHKDTTTAALRGQGTTITGCTAASNTLTFDAVTTAPSSGDTFDVI
jgi:hypothetical protein